MTRFRRSFYFLTGLFSAAAFVVTLGQGFGGSGYGASGGGGASVSDEAYDATAWNGVTTVAPSKNAVRDQIEAISVAAIAWDAIADAANAGSVAFGSLAQDITSTNDDAGEYVLRITNTDADQANDVSFLWFRHNDGADANVIYIRCTGDNDGTPTTDCRIDQTEAMFEMPLGLGAAGILVTDDGDGAMTWLGRGNGSDEDLTWNLDDTANTVTVSSSTGVADIVLTSIALQVVDEAYDATGWNGSLQVPTQNAVRDIIETFVTPDAEVATWLATPSLANFCAAQDGEGTGVCTALGANTNATDGITTPNGTATFTNKTLDFEGTGNDITTVFDRLMSFAVCQGSTATLGGNTITALGPTAVCITGSNGTRGAMQFPDSDGEFGVQWEEVLPAGWTGAVTVAGKWRTAATSGDVVLQLQVACTADAEVLNDTFAAAATTTETAKGTTLQLNDFSITATTTGCAASEHAQLRLYRQRTNASDSLTGTFDIVGPVRQTMRATR